MSQKYTYTAADLERYHSGKMSEGEMHALEKAALEDPFLADALEGYVYAGTPVKDIAELKEKLFAKTKKKKGIFILRKENALLRIAAMFILIAGIGYMAYQFNDSEKNIALAKNEDSSPIKNEDLLSMKQDSVINSQQDMATTTSPTQGNELAKDKNKLPQPELQSSQDIREKPAEFLHDQNVQTTTAPQLQRNSREVNVVKGRVVDTLGNPIQYATIKTADNKIITSSDSTGRFKMPAYDTTVTATVSVLGYATKEKKLSRNAEQVIVMQPEKQGLEEVVVTAMGKKSARKSASISTQLEGKVPGVMVDSPSQPVTGLQQFNEYIKSNINIPVDGQGKSYKGKVVLSFEINKRGNPKKIKIEQSLCKPCDEEATRLLSQGPKWKYINDRRQTVTIQF